MDSFSFILITFRSRKLRDPAYRNPVDIGGNAIIKQPFPKKENIMKKSFLRLVGTTLLLALMIGMLVSGVGWLLGWRTSVQFSNGLFIPGGILVVLGILSVMGGYGMRSDFHVVYSQSAGDMSNAERAQRWAADMTQGYSAFIFLFLTGGFLVGLAVLAGILL